MASAVADMRSRGGLKGIDPAKVAIYIRWSTDDQSDGTTLEVQMDGCKHYLWSQGWEVTDDLIFIDEGYSGGSLDRPAMTRLRKAVQEDRVDCVVVFKLDRLSRSVLDTVNLVLEEWDDLCHIKSAREPIDTTNHAGKMFFYMLVSYAEWERSVIKERTYSGRLKRAQSGRSPGINAPYGYQVGTSTGTLEIVPEEAAVVQRIFEDYLNGVGMRGLINSLNAEGPTFRGGRVWCESTMRHILMNPVYCGDLVWGRRLVNPKYGKREGEKSRVMATEPLVTSEDAFPAIIDRKVWERAQMMREGKPGRRQGTSSRAVSSQFLLTGLAKCTCGASIIGRMGMGRGTYLYYSCSGRNSKGNAGCDGGYINTEQADKVAVAELRRLFGTAPLRQELAGALHREVREKLAAATTGVREAESVLSRTAQHEADLRKQYRDGTLTLVEYREFRADLDREKESAEKRVSELKRQAVDAKRALDHAGVWTDLLEQIDEWDRLTIAQQKHLLRTICRGLTIYRKPRGHEILFEAVWVSEQSESQA